MAKRDTKTAILDAAKSIILTKGYAAAGLNEILSAAGVPKGSFYHYFKSKEDFGVELIKKNLSETAELHRYFLNDAIRSPYARFMAFYETLLEFHRHHDCREQCIVAKLGPEVSYASDAMRLAQSEGVKLWLEIIEGCIREGQDQGDIDAQLDAAATAALLHDLWQGALLRTQIDQDVSPLENAFQAIQCALSPKG